MSEQEQDQPKGFYEQKGMVRHTIILTEANKTKLKETAKTYKITQGDVVEVLLDQMDLNQIGPHFEVRHAGKDTGKTSKSELVKKLTAASPETLAAIEVLLNQGVPK